MLAALAAMGTLLPMRLGPALLDPVYLLAFSILAAIFSGTYAIQSWAGADERAWLENRGDEAPPDTEVLRGKALVATVYGVASWLLILGATLGALASKVQMVMVPPPSVLATLFVFTVAVSALGSNAAAAIAVRFESAPLARRMFRLGLFFLLVIGVLLAKGFPSLLRPLDAVESFVIAALASAVVFGFLASVAGRLVLRCLADRRISLSITP